MQTEHLLKQVPLVEPCPNCLSLSLFVQDAYYHSPLNAVYGAGCPGFDFWNERVSTMTGTTDSRTCSDTVRPSVQWVLWVKGQSELPAMRLNKMPALSVRVLMLH